MQQEEGDTLGSPITGEIDANFAGLENERKKNLRNKIIIWAAVALGIIILLTVVIILATNSPKKKEDDNTPEEVPGEIKGYLVCIYDIFEEEINILSEEFENKNNVAIYIGDKRIKFSNPTDKPLE